MGNLFRCAVGGKDSSNIVRYQLTEQGVSDGTKTLTWDCTGIPNWDKLSVNNFGVFPGAFRASSYFNGSGNSDLKSGSGASITSVDYDSSTGVLSVTCSASRSGRMNDSNIWISPAVFVVI